MGHCTCLTCRHVDRGSKSRERVPFPRRERNGKGASTALGGRVGAGPPSLWTVLPRRWGRTDLDLSLGARCPLDCFACKFGRGLISLVMTENLYPLSGSGGIDYVIYQVNRPQTTEFGKTAVEQVRKTIQEGTCPILPWGNRKLLILCSTWP